MKFGAKLILIFCIAMFGLINLRAFSFNGGFSKNQFDDDASFTERLTTLSNIEKIEYYELTFKSDDYKYNVFIKTSDGNFLIKATQDDIDAFKVLGVFSDKYTPEKISPIPIYIELIAMFVILIIPNKAKKKA